MKGRIFRWAIASLVPLAAGSLVWFFWCIVFKWPPMDPGVRLNYALAVGAAVLTVVAAPLVAWATKRKSDSGHLESKVTDSPEVRAPISQSTVISGNASNSVILSGSFAGPVSVEVDPRRPIPDEDHLKKLLETSRARTKRRLRSLNLNDNLVTLVSEFLESRTILQELSELPTGRIIALVGELGMGKSEIAESWHRLSIDAAREDGRPAPVWVDAKSLRHNENLFDAINSHCQQLGIPTSNGYDVVIDELDSLTSPRMVQKVFDEAAIFAEVNRNSRVLVTARPGYSFPKIESIQAPFLSEVEAFDLIGLIAGGRTFRLNFAPAAVDLSRIPLFCLLIGAELGERPRPINKAFLLHRLAERSIDAIVPKVDIPLNRWRTKQALSKIAIAATKGKPLTISDIDVDEALSAARVVIEGDRGELTFALPVVQQYFAAQAVLEDEIHIDELTKDLVAVTAWRYPLAVALAVGTVDQISRILGPLAREYPGIASWLVTEALSVSGNKTESSSEGQSSEVWPIDKTLNFGTSLIDAAQAWKTGLKSIAHLTNQVSASGSLRPLGVFACGKTFEAVWAPEDRKLPEVFILYPPEAPEGVEYSGFMTNNPGWGPGRWVADLGSGDWAWRWTRDEFGKEITDILQKRSLQVRPGSYVAAERNWELARSIVGKRRRVLHEPIEPLQILSVISELKQQFSAGIARPFFTINRDPRFYRESDLDHLADACTSAIERKEFLTRPAPVPDIMKPQHGWIWSFYSPQRMLELVEIVWREAFVAYRQMVLDNLPLFGPTMAKMALGEVTIDGVLRFDGGQDMSGGPSLSYRIFSTRPESNLDENLTSALNSEVSPPVMNLRIFSNSDENERMRAWRVEHEEWARLRPRGEVAAAYAHPAVGSTALSVFYESPATLLAYSWINDDLARLGWVTTSSIKDH